MRPSSELRRPVSVACSARRAIAAAARFRFLRARVCSISARSARISCFEARERFGDGFEVQRGLAALGAERFEIAPGRIHLAGEALGLALERAQRLLGLRGLVARVARLRRAAAGRGGARLRGAARRGRRSGRLRAPAAAALRPAGGSALLQPRRFRGSCGAARARR